MADLYEPLICGPNARFAADYGKFDGIEPPANYDVGTAPVTDVLARFMAIVASSPDRTAVHCGDQALSYANLDVLARQFSTAFSSTCRAPKVLVAYGQGPNAYAAMLGTMHAGGCYVPVDVSAPSEKTARIARSFKPDIIVGEPSIVDRLAETAPDARKVLLQEVEITPPASGLGVRNRQAYVIFTSGSTGTPKGVVISHTALAHYIDWVAASGLFQPADRTAQYSNIGFDLSVLEIIGALCCGATLVPFVSLDDRLTPAAGIKRHAVDVWISVPSVISLIQRGRQATAEYLGHVKRFFLIGEPLLESHVAALFAACPSAEVWNSYGPTEATVSMTVLKLTGDAYKSAVLNSVALGEAIPGMEIQVLGGENPETGELVILGPQLADGYWDDPEQTTRAFRHIVVNDVKKRAYFSGDWVRRVDGHLFFEGRIDHQVKIRGYRIEAGEIEAQLMRHPLVKEAVVIAREDEPGEKRLVGYVVPADADGAGMSVGAEALRAHLKELVPDYMIPSAFVRMAAFPLSQNDKLDRKALPAPDQKSMLSVQYEAPLDALENTIAEIFQELLGISQVGRHDNFFELGGHSLLLVRVMTSIQARLGRMPVMAWLYEAPTPAQLAALMERRKSDRRWNYVVPLREGGDATPLVCLSGFRADLVDYPNIVRYLDASMPIFGLQLPADDFFFQQSLTTRIEKYEAEIRTLQARGPYRLCGYSFGGSEAFDLACRLEAQGEEVSLVLVDAFRPSRWQSVLSWLPREILYSRELMRDRKLGLRFKENWRRLILNEQQFATPQARQDVRERALLRDAFKRIYRPFRGRVMLIKGTKLDPWALQMHADGHCGWRKYLRGPVEVVQMRARHLELMREPLVRSVASHINGFMAH